MKIGIIGAGQIGSTLAQKWQAAGHEVRLANSRGPDSLRQLAQQTGAMAVTAEGAVDGVDALVISIPQGAVSRLPKQLFADVPPTTVIMDTGNYYPDFRDDPIPEIEAGMPESQWVAEQIGRPVVKVFNNITAESLVDKGRPAGDPRRIALSIAGDSYDAKRFVVELVNDLGFDGVDAGSLADSWRQQPGTPAYCQDLTAPELMQALASADRAAAPAARDVALKEYLASLDHQ